MDRLRLCKQYWTKKGCSKQADCNQLHLCRYFMTHFCKNTECQFSHNVKNIHNCEVLRRANCDHVTEVTLRHALKQQSINAKFTRRVPDLCKFYNHYGDRGGCKHGDGEDSLCSHLHVCRHYVLGDCKYGHKCKYSHDITKAQPKACLIKFGMEVRKDSDVISILDLLRENSMKAEDESLSLTLPDDKCLSLPLPGDGYMALNSPMDREEGFGPTHLEMQYYAHNDYQQNFPLPDSVEPPVSPPNPLEIQPIIEDMLAHIRKVAEIQESLHREEVTCEGEHDRGHFTQYTDYYHGQSSNNQTDIHDRSTSERQNWSPELVKDYDHRPGYDATDRSNRARRRPQRRNQREFEDLSRERERNGERGDVRNYRVERADRRGVDGEASDDWQPREWRRNRGDRDRSYEKRSRPYDRHRPRGKPSSGDHFRNNRRY